MSSAFSDIKPIAFYLPQFYETPYNDEWWGAGFTEWTSARRGEKLFPGHHQPQLPPTGDDDLGFHNQTDLKTLKAQAALAKAYGVYGFCHYFYWFGGRRVLEKPTDLMLAHPEVDMPFCLSWANENWSRRWDGGDTDILIPQDYDPERYHELAADLAPYFSDPRYITSDGEVIFLIYRPDEIPDLPRLSSEIKKQAIACGHKGALVLGTETFCVPGQQADPRKQGLDGNVEFPPHGVSTMQVHTVARDGQTKFEGMVFDHFSAFLTTLKRPSPDYKLFRGLFPAWDNTARRGRRANIFAGSSAQLFANWLSAPAFGLEAFFAKGDLNEGGSLPYQLVLPPGAMAPETAVPSDDNVKLAEKGRPWVAHLKRARSFKEVKTALWLAWHHDYPQTTFQKFTTSVVRRLSKPLALFNDADKLRRLQERSMRACIEPCCAII